MSIRFGCGIGIGMRAEMLDCDRICDWDEEQGFDSGFGLGIVNWVGVRI